jgi:hypothetical protein
MAQNTTRTLDLSGARVVATYSLEVSLVQLHMAERSTPAGHVLRAHGTTPRWLLRLRLRGWGLR